MPQISGRPWLVVCLFMTTTLLRRGVLAWLPASRPLCIGGSTRVEGIRFPLRHVSSSVSRRASEQQEGGDGTTYMERREDDAGRTAADSDPSSPSEPQKVKSKLRSIRQHVNPLASTYQQKVELDDDWVEKAYAKPDQPFHIDIGSGRGQFCVNMAREFPEVNFLGLEIRRPCVEESLKKVEKYGVSANLHYIACNANVDYDRIAADINARSRIVRASIQYPDPHFKKKHAKRRMVQVELSRSVASSLCEDGEVFLQSDLQWVAENMRECFSGDPLIEDTMPQGEWMAENPLGVPTEREKLTLSRGDPVFRTIFRRVPGVRERPPVEEKEGSKEEA